MQAGPEFHMDFKITQARACACPDRIGLDLGQAIWMWVRVSVFRTQVEACVGLKPNPQMT